MSRVRNGGRTRATNAAAPPRIMFAAAFFIKTRFSRFAIRSRTFGSIPAKHSLSRAAVLSTASSSRAAGTPSLSARCSLGIHRSAASRRFASHCQRNMARAAAPASLACPSISVSSHKAGRKCSTSLTPAWFTLVYAAYHRTPQHLAAKIGVLASIATCVPAVFIQIFLASTRYSVKLLQAAPPRRSQSHMRPKPFIAKHLRTVDALFRGVVIVPGLFGRIHGLPPGIPARTPIRIGAGSVPRKPR
jgi:hypothetical protein